MQKKLSHLAVMLLLDRLKEGIVVLLSQAFLIQMKEKILKLLKPDTQMNYQKTKKETKEVLH